MIGRRRHRLRIRLADAAAVRRGPLTDSSVETTVPNGGQHGSGPRVQRTDDGGLPTPWEQAACPDQSTSKETPSAAAARASFRSRVASFAARRIAVSRYAAS